MCSRFVRTENVTWWLRYSSDDAQAELIGEWNPHNPVASSEVACTLLWLGVERSDDGWVNRVDVCWDARRDPYRVLLDYPRCRKSSHGYGLTPRGYETLVVGYAKGEKRKMRRYDKRSERISAGDDDPGLWCRVETEAWAPFLPCGGVGELPPGEPTPIRLRDLATILCPLRPCGAVVELVRDPEEFADERFLALACVAMQLGPKSVRYVARKLLGASEVERAEFCLYVDQTPDLVAAFDRQWVKVVGGLLAAVASVVPLVPS